MLGNKESKPKNIFFIGEPQHLFRILLLVIIPFFLGLWIMPHVQYVTGNPISAPAENSTSQSSQPLSYSFTQADFDTLASQKVNAVFPLANYVDFPPFVSRERLQFCFEEQGSSIVLANGTRIFPTITWAVTLNNETQFEVVPGMAACADVRPGQQNSYTWSANITAPLPSDQLAGATFDQKKATYPRVAVDYGLLQGIAMIPVFYLLIWYPAAGIWKKIKEGMEAQ